MLSFKDLLIGLLAGMPLMAQIPKQLSYSDDMGEYIVNDIFCSSGVLVAWKYKILEATVCCTYNRIVIVLKFNFDRIVNLYITKCIRG